jgi:hypothetical protein
MTGVYVACLEVDLLHPPSCQDFKHHVHDYTEIKFISRPIFRISGILHEEDMRFRLRTSKKMSDMYTYITVADPNALAV